VTCLSRAGGGPVASPRKVVEDDKDLAETGVGSDHFLSTGHEPYRGSPQIGPDAGGSAPVYAASRDPSRRAMTPPT
jgi:hypothetical protein